MPFYRVQEFQNIDDPNIARCCIGAQGVRSALERLFQELVAQVKIMPVSDSVLVAMAGIQRLTELGLSTELLCVKNRARDAAILVLTAVELRLDLQYIALDPSRATVWLEHAKSNQKPWRVAQQLEAVYSNNAEALEAERDNYRRYSMVKHCNPVGSIFSFPLSVSKSGILMEKAAPNNELVAVHAFAVGSCLEEGGQAVISLLSREGFDFAASSERLRNSMKALSDANEKHIIGILQRTARANT